jgi:hypothetical protein
MREISIPFLEKSRTCTQFHAVSRVISREMGWKFLSCGLPLTARNSNFKCMDAEFCHVYKCMRSCQHAECGRHGHERKASEKRCIVVWASVAPVQKLCAV